MNLKKIVDNLFEDSKRTPVRGLSAIAEAEKYLQQAYEGRYFFELIQNVRDANKEIGQDGTIYTELRQNILSISNSGAEFGPKGIMGITTIGQSTKKSQDYIGFKGIGFKSIQELTERPSIITKYGSVYFDRKETLNKYGDQILKEDQVPLFYFPHFNQRRLSDTDIKKGIVTRIELPIKDNITEEKIISDFSDIQAKQLVLLGNIKALHFHSETQSKTYHINNNYQKRLVEISDVNKSIAKFKYYTPKDRVNVPDSVINSLEGKEKEIFGNETEIDISIVLELSDAGHIKPIIDSKLYLFYPLQISSGFRFIIHSYFIVNPERTALRSSPLNDFLLKEIGIFVSGEMLQHLKRGKSNTNKVLCFKRNTDAKLKVLYDCIVDRLKSQQFIFDKISKKYFFSSDVIVANGFDKGLFPDNKLGGKQLIYLDDDEVISWLKNEFQITYLTYESIAEEIEKECRHQAKKKNLKFFQNLYNYVRQHDELNLTKKKVLLTSDWKLVSSDDSIFYGGAKRRRINLTENIRKQIHFIHKDIKITDFREGRSRTGIIEFNTYELVRRLLKLFDEKNVPNIELLNALYNLQPVDAKSELEIRERILLPIKGDSKWLSPITSPIYFDTNELRDLYPNGYFVDESNLVWRGEIASKISSQKFLKDYGVWSIPAAYISDKNIRVYHNEKREQILNSFSGLTSRPYYIKYDRVLDKPVKYNFWFTRKILENWAVYREFINFSQLPKMLYSTSQTTYARAIPIDKMVILSSFLKTLSTEKWILFSGETNAFLVSEIVGISMLDFYQGHNQVISRHLKLLPVSYEFKKELIDALGMLHLDADNIDNYIRLLRTIYNKNSIEIPQSKEFIDFYNRILSKLVDFYYRNTQNDSILKLKSEYFLGIDEISKKNTWCKACDIFHIDDKPNYNLLPLSIRERLQPHFTNRDRNTFGKIAIRIGKKFSSSIQRELVLTSPLKTTMLVSYFSLLPEALAILESYLDIVINDYIEKLKTIRVIEKEKLQLKVSIDGSDEFISVPHFIDLNSNFDIHISTTETEGKNKQISNTLNELFINVLNRDLKKYNLDLLQYLSTPNKKEYLAIYDISENRISEIRAALTSSKFSPNQKFWESILNARGLSMEDLQIESSSVNVTNLSTLLGIEQDYLQMFNTYFDFNDFNNYKNIEVLSALLDLLGLTLEELNEKLFPKIDFQSFYNQKLNRVKSAFEKKFIAILHDYLSSKDSNKQSGYQDYIDKYKEAFLLSIPLNTLQIDIEDFFINSLNIFVKFITFSKTDLNKDVSSFNPVTIFIENQNQLAKKLSNVEYTPQMLDLFLSDNKTRSLLYFSNIDKLINKFTSWLKEKKKESRPSVNEDSIEGFLKEFTNLTDVDIETVSTNEGEGSFVPSGGNGGTTGRRFDGSVNDKNKMIIGMVAEMIVFEKLKKVFNNVRWVSKYASKVYKSHPGYNPEGQDGLGYDIEYFDTDSNKYFVEVKGRSDGSDSFEITSHEINKAQSAKEFYKIIFVTHTLDNSQRRIRDLGNLFLLEDGQDFFANSKFKAVYRNFEIRFKEL